MTCAQTIVRASHCVGLTLPGMMDEPGSFSGKLNSPSPERGPEPSKRISLAILLSEAAIVLSMPDISTNASWAARASNLFSAVTKSRPVKSATSAANFSANPGLAFSPVPTAVPPCANAKRRGMDVSTRSIEYLSCVA